MRDDRIPEQFRDLIVDVRERYEKWSAASKSFDVQDALEIFRRTFWDHSKKWGTYLELVPIMIVQRDGTKVETNICDDPNLVDDYMFSGFESEGFSAGIRDRHGKQWKAELDYPFFKFTELAD